MSSSEYSKCVTVNESNIPIAKKSYTGAKKSKGCAQLPELQKYIETIIKASSECDSADASMSDKDKFPKEKKFGRQTVPRGNDNKIKQNRNKLDLNRRKIKTKPKTPARCEAVSSGVEITNKFVSNFEDPRNWKIDRTQNLGPNLRIENFLKKLYPNPYNLASLKDFKKSKAKFSFENVEKDDLRDGTLPDVVISKVDAQTEVDFDKPDKVLDADTQLDLEKTNNVVKNAETEIKPNERENNIKAIAPALVPENCKPPPPPKDHTNENSKNNEVINAASDSTKRTSVNKKKNPASNVSSRVSSLESLGEVLCNERQMKFKKKKNFKIKNKSLEEDVNKTREAKLLNFDSEIFEGDTNDCDIGKLKLLSLSDSDDSAPKKFQTEQVKDTKDDPDDPVLNTDSEIRGSISRTNELNDLLQIYSVMNKATESFLLISSKNNLINSELEILQNLEEEKIAPLLSDQHHNNDIKPLRQENEEKDKTEFSDVCTVKGQIKNSDKIKSTDEIKFGKDDDEGSKKSDENNLQNASFKEPCLKKNTDETSSEDKTSKSKDEKLFSNIIGDSDKSIASDNLNDKKLDDNFKKELESNQKIDEVLQFMYECLIKFNNQEKFLQEKEKRSLEETNKLIIKPSKKFSGDNVTDVKREKPSTSQLYKKKSCHPTTENDSSESLSTKSLPEVKEIHSKYTAALGELNRIQSPRAPSKRRSENFAPGLAITDKTIKRSVSRQHFPVMGSETFSEFDLDLQSLPLPDSFEVHNESYIQTVESQNELGGFAEEMITVSRNPNSDLRISKPLLPLSVKIKRSKTDTCKTLKDVLETEEKLLACEFSDKHLELKKTEREKTNEFMCVKSNHILIKNNTISSYSLKDDFEPPNSNFVICVNSFPRSLRKVALRPSISPPPPVTISMSDIKAWNLKPLAYYPKHRLKKFSIPAETKHCATELSYKVKEGTILMMNKTTENYTATPVCVKVTVNVSKLQEEPSLKNSECHFKIKPIKKSLFVETNSPEFNKRFYKNTLTLKSSISNLVASENKFNLKRENEKPVEALLESLKEAEENVFLLEKTSVSNENLYRSSESLCSFSESEILRCGNEENEEQENNKKKVQDLLLRTYNLQKKLHRYLHKITCIQPKTLSCPLIQKEQFLDFGLFLRDKTDSNFSLTELEIDQEHSLPLVQWYLQSPTTGIHSKADEAIAVNVQMVDCGTSYNPPFEEESKTSEDQSNEAKYSSLSEKEEIYQDDEDDRSSNCSFKSSNDFSESNENRITPKGNTNKASQGELIEKLYNKIESFRQSFEEEKLKNQEKKDSKDVNNEKFNLKKMGDLKENRLVEYDPKTTAKVLKTIFRGRKSSTELTIGLKDVPMTKVNNISVEKTKFSPNHTKISICISKEKPSESRQPNKTNNELLHNKFSSYYFDSLRPSLSTCQTEYSRLNDDVSKSSQSFFNELNKSEVEVDEDEDEEDYKSVGSTVGDLEGDEVREEKLKPKEPTAVEVPPPKNFTKHRFDFYRKMDLNKEESKTRQSSLTNTWSTYKELEPLKQALTEMQIRMRSIKRDAILSSDEYYQRALKLAKMSAGFCQSCGTRAVIPEDTFGFYKTLLPRRCMHSHRNRHIRPALSPNSSFYSFRAGNAEVKDQYCDLNIKHSSSYLLNRTTHVRSSLHDMPILFERM